MCASDPRLPDPANRRADVCGRPVARLQSASWRGDGREARYGSVVSLTLTTTRLRIAPLTRADVPAFVAYRQDPDVARWQSWDVTYSSAEATDLVDTQGTSLPSPGEWLQLGAHARDTDVLLGDVAVHTLSDQPDTYELGVTMSRAAQGSGFATEAMSAVLAHLFAVGAHRVVAFSDARNEPVARLLTRIGMRHEGRQVDADWFGGEWTTLDLWAVLASERVEPR